MASVYRRENSKVWQCAFYIPTPDGALKIRRSTGKTNRREAERIAMALEKAERDSAGVSEEKGHKIHAILNAASEDALKEKLTVSKARKYLSLILQEASGEELCTYTIKGWAEEWLARKTKTVSVATRKRYTASVRSFLEWLGAGASKPLESVTTSLVREFRDHLHPGGRTARTVNHYLKDIGSVLRAAVREGLLTSNPAASLEALPLDDSVERQPFTAAEVLRLARAAPNEDWKGLILTGAFTGLRLADCARLIWGNVDLEAACLTITPQKTRRKRVQVRIPLHPELQAFFEEHPITDDPADYVFPSLARKGTNGNKGLSTGFVRIMEAANVSRGEAHQGIRKNHARGFHSLRYTFTSWLANAGVSPEVRQAMTGHLDDGSHKLYTHHSPETLRGAIDQLPSLEAGGP